MPLSTHAAASPDVRAAADLQVKLFADGADLQTILDFAGNPLIKGFTTNPTLMRRAGISDYAAFAQELLAAVTAHPISLEVFADEFPEMERQACRIAEWGRNVYVKIPITNTRGESSLPLVERLARRGVKQNVTALLTLDQVDRTCAALAGGPPACISVFAGRIADTGRNPLPTMIAALELIKEHRGLELIWASPRQLYNVMEADEIGCHIITVTTDLLKKLAMLGTDLDELSLDTVKMFRDDAVRANYSL